MLFSMNLFFTLINYQMQPGLLIEIKKPALVMLLDPHTGDSTPQTHFLNARISKARPVLLFKTFMADS